MTFDSWYRELCERAERVGVPHDPEDPNSPDTLEDLRDVVELREAQLGLAEPGGKNSCHAPEPA